MKTRIVFNARGGIGNQLFIAAAAIDFSSQLRCRTYISLLDIDSSHSASGANLKKFGFSRNIFLDSNPFLYLIVLLSRKKHLPFNLNLLISRFVLKFNDEGNRNLNIEILKKRIQSNPNSRIIIVSGFFQDFSYASELMQNREQIFNQLVNPCLLPMEKNYLAVHIRLGDMLQHKDSFGVLSEGYYVRAVNHVSQKSQLKMELFSDDYVSARMMLSFYQEKLIQKSIRKSHQDPIFEFYSIANATHIITSNSTFSMWAAFVSRTAKVVVVPRQFRFDGLSEIGSLPSSWETIESSWMI